jgi:hypothetical protein
MKLGVLGSTLTRKSIYAIVIVAMAVPGSTLAASSASASPKVDVGLHLCETSGSHYCVGAPTVHLDDPVVEAIHGRLLNFNPAGSGTELQLVADTSLCVAAANNGQDVVQHPCNGGAGVIWHEVQGPATTLYESNEFPGKYLSGANNNGSQFQLKDRGATGWEQQFTAGA